jgi:molecular chaperone DnaJ
LVRVREHPRFERDGDRLHTRVSVLFPQAALGCEIPIETLDGEELLDIPPGSQPGETFRLRGKGMPRLRGKGRGDLIVHLSVEVPRDLTERQRTLLQALAKEMDVSVKENESFLDKLKSFFG